jgi:hypothetical protein
MTINQNLTSVDGFKNVGKNDEEYGRHKNCRYAGPGHEKVREYKRKENSQYDAQNKYLPAEVSLKPPITHSCPLIPGMHPKSIPY